MDSADLLPSKHPATNRLQRIICAGTGSPAGECGCQAGAQFVHRYARLELRRQTHGNGSPVKETANGLLNCQPDSHYILRDIPPKTQSTFFLSLEHITDRTHPSRYTKISPGVNPRLEIKDNKLAVNAEALKQQALDASQRRLQDSACTVRPRSSTGFPFTTQQGEQQV